MLSRCDVVLVGTSNPENLGSVARLLENFGLPSLTLVAPRVAPDDHRALVVGRAAQDRLRSARTVATLAEGVAAASFAVAFSARRGGERECVGLRALPSLLARRAPAGRIALVFGPEDTGLVAADVARCEVACAIELPGALSSLNLSQAVALALWELARPVEAHDPAAAIAREPATGHASLPSRAGEGLEAPSTQSERETSSTDAEREAPSTHAEREALLDHAVAALDAIGYRRDEDRERKRLHLRRIFARAALARAEVRGLHGLCAQVLRLAGRAG